MSYPVLSNTIPLSLVKGGFKKTPHFNTVVQNTAAKRGISTASLMPYATWDFTVDLEYVSGGEAVANSILQLFLSCYLQCCGGGSFFLFQDPNDNTVTSPNGIALNVTSGAATPMGTAGDGTSTIFQLAREIGSGIDVLQNVTVNSVYVGGTLLSGTAYSVSSTGVITFQTAPGSGQTITWSGSFNYLCRFSADSLKSLARVSKNSSGFLWSCSSIEFESVFI